ncbi:MAG: fimbrillin family protein [Alistipes sp.]|nr:fimbrillin family protein [Alistipes sp.]
MIKVILKYAICGVMFIAGCGCSSDEIVSLPDEYICFDSSVTRAVVEQATDMGSFKVWGWHTTSGQSAAAQDFDGVEVTFDNYTREWSYSPPRAWIWNSTHTFYALYPATIEGNYTVDGKLNIDNLDLRQNNSYNNLQSIDLMQAKQSQSIMKNAPDFVSLNFDHMLSSVNFSFKMHNSNEGDKMEVTYVLVNGMKCYGTMQEDEWQLSEPSYLWKKLDTPISLITQSYKTCMSDVLMFPQDIAAGEVTLYVSYNYTPSGASNAITKIMQAVLPAGRWEAGKKINYTGVIEVDNNIEFATPTVEPWGTEQVGGTIIIQ